ncbi:MAG: flagellar biosynthetic protein FliR [Candidatus Zixiibacteriota bacterium]|nr:MAG: flagellar biosynthetic protein FliR [candidate division Zixibacteria bacterium]
MFEFVNYGADKLQIFLLILLRASGLFVISPILSHRSVPRMAKAGLVLLFSIILVSVLPDPNLAEVRSLPELLGIAFREVFIGAIIGFTFALLFYAVHGAGSLVGYQIGFAMALVLDPTSKTQQSVMSQLWYVVATLIFLTINGHHMIISAFADSYTVMPPGHVVVAGSAGELVIKYSFYVFTLALKLVAPVTVTLFLTDVALGIVAKMMPTMNVFIVGFPLKIGTGLVILAFSLPIFSYVLQRATGYLDGQLGSFLGVMGKA